MKSVNVHYFCALKQCKLPSASVRCSLAASSAPRAFDVFLETDNAAHFVYLTSGNIAGRMSDNGFLMLPGKKYQVTVEVWQEVQINQLMSQLAVKSLKETY